LFSGGILGVTKEAYKLTAEGTVKELRAGQSSPHFEKDHGEPDVSKDGQHLRFQCFGLDEMGGEVVSARNPVHKEQRRIVNRSP
jgi:hypothetical protein